jgi:radical SAM-linked protein
VKGIVAETTGRPLPEGEVAPPPPPARPPVSLRYRVRYAKQGRLRFVSHLDLLRTLPKVFRRAGVRLTYSEGFHPKPRLSFGPALAVGLESSAEYLDFESPEPQAAPDLLGRLNAAAPAGLRFLELRLLAGERAGSEPVKRASYEARLTAPPSTPALAALARAKAGEEIRIRRTRKGETEDVALGPQLKDLTWDGTGNVSMTLALDAGATLRPNEVLQGLVGDEARGASLRRSALWVERDGRMVSPLASPSA